LRADCRRSSTTSDIRSNVMDEDSRRHLAQPKSAYNPVKNAVGLWLAVSGRFWKVF
jgi:hypothetical protein